MQITTNDTHVVVDRWGGGPARCSVLGTFGGATVQIAYKEANGDWAPMGDSASFTAEGSCRLDLNERDAVAAIVSGGTGTAINVAITKLKDE